MSSLAPGQLIDGKYRVGRLIGEGGMGTVFEGENSRIGRRVAIKVLHAQVASLPEFVERFEREARAAARIGSAHVCDVLDLGDLPNGNRYIVMEYLDGCSFEDRIVQRGTMTPAQLAPIAFELLEGLGTMHLAKVIHRDLKPANVFLARQASGRGETVKILDFGIAKLQPFEGQVGTMTQTGTMMGTPLYMSPEQARGARDVDGRTDLYAASVMFYRSLAGVLPYTGETLNELLFKIVLEDPPQLRDVVPDIDEVFAAIVHKGLARDITQRFQTAREYQEAIAAWGKTQGRSSLSFAVRTPTDPPPATPDIPRPGPASNLQSLAVAARPNDGTPFAWSEDGQGGQGRQGVRPAAGAPSDPSLPGSTVPSVPPAPPARARGPSTGPATPAGYPAPPPASVAGTTGPAIQDSATNSPPGTGPARDGSMVKGPGTSTPSGIAPRAHPASEPPRAIAPSTMPRKSEPPTRSGLVSSAPSGIRHVASVRPPMGGGARIAIPFAILGMLGAVGVALFYAFGRGTHLPEGVVGSSSAEPVAVSVVQPSATVVEPTASIAEPPTVPGGADPAVSQASSDAPTANSPQKRVGRRIDPVPPAPTSAAPVVEVVPSAPSPVGSATASTKPRASATRKFRTNID